MRVHKTELEPRIFVFVTTAATHHLCALPSLGGTDHRSQSLVKSRSISSRFDRRLAGSTTRKPRGLVRQVNAPATGRRAARLSSASSLSCIADHHSNPIPSIGILCGIVLDWSPEPFELSRASNGRHGGCSGCAASGKIQELCLGVQRAFCSAVLTTHLRDRTRQEMATSAPLRMHRRTAHRRPNCSPPSPQSRCSPGSGSSSSSSSASGLPGIIGMNLVPQHRRGRQSTDMHIRQAANVSGELAT